MRALTKIIISFMKAHRKSGRSHQENGCLKITFPFLYGSLTREERQHGMWWPSSNCSHGFAQGNCNKKDHSVTVFTIHYGWGSALWTTQTRVFTYYKVQHCHANVLKRLVGRRGRWMGLGIESTSSKQHHREYLVFSFSFFYPFFQFFQYTLWPHASFPAECLNTANYPKRKLCTCGKYILWLFGLLIDRKSVV